MKKIFAFAIALVAMATSMVSCNNDNADFIEQKAPVAPNTTQVENQEVKTSFDGKIYFAATDSQLEYVNSIYNVTVNGETFEVNIKDLPVATDLPSLANQNEVIKAVNPTFYVYQVPAEAKGSVKLVPNYSIKEGVELPASIDMTSGLAVNGRNSIKTSRGLHTENLETLLNRMNTVISFTFAIK